MMKLGFLNLLTIIFVIAKLTGMISWSWWLVFAPSLICVGIALIFWLLVLAMLIIGAVWG